MKTMIREIPNGTKAILMIHGILGRPGHFTPFMDSIPEDFSVYNILLDGHGGSAKEFSRSSMKKWREQALAWAKQLTEQYETVVIAGHSMGCLFAIEAAALYPQQIKAIFLLAPALRIRLTFSAVWGSIKTALGVSADQDPMMRAKLDACGVVLPSNPLQYLSWLPRFAELLKESAAIRKQAANLIVPSVVLLSKKGELVSPRSGDFFTSRANIHLLPNSTHYYYPPADLKTIRNVLHKVCCSVSK